MKNKDDILKNINAEQTKQSFTQSVMKDIYALENEKKVHKLIKTESALTVSDSFSKNVMKDVSSVKRKQKRRSILNLKEKSLFILVSAFFILLLFFSKPSNNLSFYNKVDFNFLTSFSNNENLSFVTIIFTCITLLLLKNKRIS